MLIRNREATGVEPKTTPFVAQPPGLMHSMVK